MQNTECEDFTADYPTWPTAIKWAWNRNDGNRMDRNIARPTPIQSEAGQLHISASIFLTAPSFESVGFTPTVRSL
jgi:hypothetical protein